MNLIGKSLKNRYYIISLIGEGGMAEVYLANDVINKREVAIKIIKDSTSLDPLNIARFQREARASAALRHKNIIEIYDVDEYMGKPYMVMEYVNGESLKEVLKKRGTFTPVEACDIIYQLSDALSHAHEHGVIHRDVKPQNVMIKNDGSIKLGDFGIALVNDAPHITQNDIVLGSVHYMAPEVAEGKGATCQSDIYSLGITFFELLTGKLPFNDANAVNIAMKQIGEPLPSVRKYRTDVDRRIEKVINKACSKEIKNRYASMRELKKDLQNAMCVEDKKENFLSKLIKKVKKDA
jgi:serine/threonine-protein kinase